MEKSRLNVISSQQIVKTSISSDEIHLKSPVKRAQFAKRRPGERFHQDCVVQFVKHPQAVMIWSCITHGGSGRLYSVNETVDARRYQDVIKTVPPYYAYL